MPSVVAAVLPHVDGVARRAQDTPQSGAKPLRPRTRGLQAGGDDAGEPDAGEMDHGSGDLAGPHRGPADGRVVPEQSDDLAGRERVLPLRGRRQGRGRPRRGQPLLAGDVRLPWDGGGGCYEYIPWNWIHALYSYPLRIRAEHAYP